MVINVEQTWRNRVEKIIKDGIGKKLSEDDILSNIRIMEFDMGMQQFSFYYKKCKKYLERVAFIKTTK